MLDFKGDSGQAIQTSSVGMTVENTTLNKVETLQSSLNVPLGAPFMPPFFVAENISFKLIEHILHFPLKLLP